MNGGACDALMLAYAGLRRLGIAQEADVLMNTALFVPAAAQGAIGIEMRSEDTSLSRIVSLLHHNKSALAVSAERAALAIVDGNCHTPIGVHAQFIAGGKLLQIHGQIQNADRIVVTGSVQGEVHDDMSAQKLGEALGQQLRDTL